MKTALLLLSLALAACGDNDPGQPPPTCLELGCAFALCNKAGPDAVCYCKTSPDEDAMECVRSEPPGKP